MRAAIEALEGAGYAVEEVEAVPRLTDALDAYGRMILTEFGPSWTMVKKLLTEDGRRYIEISMQQRALVGLGEYV